MAEYKIVTLALSAARDREQVISRHISVVALAVLDLTAGARVDLSVGDGKPLIPVVSPQMAFDVDPPEEFGIFASNTAQPGASVTIMVSYDDEREIVRAAPVAAPQEKVSWWRRAWR